ncbi:MAG: glycoside hydrolase family 127 protein [Chloroflexota bacterium]
MAEAAASLSVASVLPTAAAVSVLRPLDASNIAVTGGFWADRAAMNRERTIPAGFEQLRAVGTLENFRLAANAAREGYRALGIMFDKPFPFLDSDVYKWLEGAGWELARADNPEIRAMADEAIGLVEAAQRPDGYLNTFVQVLATGTEYRDLQWGHELYCIGHLVQAAIPWHRALGDDRLLIVAGRACASVERELGPGRRDGIDGHPEIEMALVELSRATGERRWLELAASFIDRRGRGWLGKGRFGRAYWQDHLPVREAPEPVGHAVRQLYLDAGAVDVAVETGDRELLEAVHERWRTMVASKTYMTGAVGSRHKDEAFGDAFELPPDRAYAETCAAIASVMLAWRLLLATGDPACADLIERTVYNAILPALSIEGTEFFYVNPLQRRTHRTWSEPGSADRQPWYACACCPPNLMRLVGSWHHMLATTTDRGVQLWQYASAELATGAVRLRVETGYPWSGDVRVTVLESDGSEWELFLRVPSWSDGATVRDDRGEVVGATAGAPSITVSRRWQPGDSVTLSLDMSPRAVVPDPRVDAIRGCIALTRGPLVYAIESADLPAGVELEDVAVSDDPRLVDDPRPDIGDAVVGLIASAEVTPASSPLDLRAVPYFAWGNRGDGGMRVWIPRAGP